MDQFSAISKLLTNKRIWYFASPGNAGDTLIHAGAACLFKKINTTIVGMEIRPDYLVWGGGGNLGTLWKGNKWRRKQLFDKAITLNVPIVILPQSATDINEELPRYIRIFAREKYTQNIYPESILAPDTALAFDGDISIYKECRQEFDVGVFLRRDRESNGGIDKRLSICDPAFVSKNYTDYMRICSLFQTIITDRLHLAITSLILNRNTVLLPNCYYKNLGVYEAWLKGLNCLWGVEELTRIIGAVDYQPKQIGGHFETVYKRKVK